MKECKIENYNRDWSQEFVYDESSPSGLVWAADRYRGSLKNPYVFRNKGDIVGSVDAQGYWMVNIKQNLYKVHRIVWVMNNGHFDNDSDVLDHIDGDKLNNNISNLRLVKRAENSRNAKKYSNNTSGNTGVYYEETHNHKRYKAKWVDVEGNPKSKSFNVNKYGDELAEFLAIEYRQHQIDLLNLMGARYSERHGS